jgi:hypothetical protein
MPHIHWVVHWVARQNKLEISGVKKRKLGCRDCCLCFFFGSEKQKGRVTASPALPFSFITSAFLDILGHFRVLRHSV